MTASANIPLARRHHLEREGKPDADMGEGFADDEEFGE